MCCTDVVSRTSPSSLLWNTLEFCHAPLSAIFVKTHNARQESPILKQLHNFVLHIFFFFRQKVWRLAADSDRRTCASLNSTLRQLGVNGFFDASQLKLAMLAPDGALPGLDATSFGSVTESWSVTATSPQPARQRKRPNSSLRTIDCFFKFHIPVLSSIQRPLFSGMCPRLAKFDVQRDSGPMRVLGRAGARAREWFFGFCDGIDVAALPERSCRSVKVCVCTHKPYMQPANMVKGTNHYLWRFRTTFSLPPRPHTVSCPRPCGDRSTAKASRVRQFLGNRRLSACRVDLSNLRAALVQW